MSHREQILYDAQYSAPYVEEELTRSKIGEPLDKKGRMVTGNLQSNSMWMAKPENGDFVEMHRYMFEDDNGQRQIVDVYSDVVKTRIEDGVFRNGPAAKSIQEKLVTHVEKTNLRLLGWLPIPETDEHRAPTYRRSSKK